MRIRQYVYFSISSNTLNPDEISHAVGMDCDSAMWRGARLAEPPRPASNAWKLEATSVGDIGDQVEELLNRLAPAVSEIRKLSQGGDVSLVMQIVRSFDDPDGVEEELTSGDGFEKVAGQHQLLGFSLSEEVLAKLGDLGCMLDFDEYG